MSLEQRPIRVRRVVVRGCELTHESVVRNELAGLAGTQRTLGEVGDRWHPLARIAEGHVEDTELVFASLHYLMPLLKTGHPAAARLLATLEAWSARDTTQGRVVAQVALDVAHFLEALNRRDRASAAAAHDRFRQGLHRIGGSHAQRALFHLLNDAA